MRRHRFLFASLLVLLAGCATPAYRASRSDGEIGLQKARTYLSRIEPFGFAGAVVLQHRSEPQLRWASGPLAADSRRLRVQSAFEVGSIAKQFTAAGILRAQKEGRLRVTDSVGKFFPNAPDDKKAITVHQLMTHTSGLEVELPEDRPLSRDSAIGLILSSEMPRATERGFGYSNAGYTLLAAIIEVATGQSYEQFLRSRLFVPAGMSHTGMVLPNWDQSEIAQGISSGKSRGTPMQTDGWLADGPPWSLRGAGGMLATPLDLARWPRALGQLPILDKGDVAAMVTPHAALPPNPLGWTAVGYAWFLSKQEGASEVRIQEGTDGIFFGQLRWYPTEDLVVSFLTNTQESGSFFGEDALRATAKAIGEAAIGRPVRMPSRQARRISDHRVVELAGEYILPKGGRITLTNHAGDLIAEAHGQEAVDILISLPDHAEAGDLSNRARVLLEGLFNNDTAELVRASRTGSAQRNLNQVERHRAAGEKALGAFRGFSIPGTVYPWWSPDGSRATFVRLQFDRGTRIFRIHWRSGQISAFGGSAIPSPARLALAQVSESELIGFHPLFEMNGTIGIERVNNVVTALSFGKTRAVRR